MKKIYIIAYCKKNLGDDLFIRVLLRRYPDCKFELFAPPKYTKAFKNETNLSTPSAAFLFFVRLLFKTRILKLSDIKNNYKRKNDAIVRIGGSIFIEPKNWSDSSQFIPDDKIYTPIFYIGANFGPHKSQSFFEDVKRALGRASDCCFRDSYSLNLFSDLKNTRKAPDILFGYPYYPPETEGEGIGISVISLDNRIELSEYAKAYYSSLAGLCDLCYEKKISVTLYSFCGPEGDEKAISDILKLVRYKDYVRVCCYKNDMDSFLKQLNKCKSLLATRFHAMVLGWSMKKRVIPIIYSNKLLNVINDVKYNGALWNLINGETIQSKQLLDMCLSADRFDTDLLREKSVEHFQKLDEFIN